MCESKDRLGWNAAGPPLEARRQFALKQDSLVGCDPARPCWSLWILLDERDVAVRNLAFNLKADESPLTSLVWFIPARI